MLLAVRTDRVFWSLAGLLGVALAGCSTPQATTPQPPEPAPLTLSSPAVDDLRAAVDGASLVICVIDAARPDHIGCYGYPRETTPNLDRLSQQALVFERHFCQYPHTKPSTASLFTAKYPDTHLAYRDRRLDRSNLTLSQQLRAAGFHTAIFTSNHYASPTMGVGADCDVAYFQPHLRSRGQTRGQMFAPEALLDLISSWLEQEPPSPFFAYVHFMPPHFPYHAPKEMKQLFIGRRPPNAWRHSFEFPELEPDMRAQELMDLDSWVNLYDANLLWADWGIGELERLLREAGVFENTLFIVTSDHGQAFGEHGYRRHTRGVYDELVHIPLLMKFPGDQAPVGRIDALTQTIDLFPTICDLFEIPYPRDQVQGRSLLPLMAGEVEKVNDCIFACADGEPPSYLVRDTRSALVLYRGGKLRALYDLENDPRQLNNVIQEQPHRAAKLEEAFRAFAETQVCKPFDFIDPHAKPGKIPRVPKAKLSKRDREELRALGYVE